ncbi:MAG TPA: fatty acid desaturase family protein [Pseudomonadales bacterium]
MGAASGRESQEIRGRRPLPQPPGELLTAEELRSLTRLSPWRSTWLIVHCWGVILATWVAVGIWTHPLTVLLGILIIGARQLGLGILMHDGAHMRLYRNKRLNDWVCEWILSRPLLGASVDGYRKYHLQHHRFTQQAEDPDLGLSRPFPIPRASLRRKILRDLTGRTGIKQYGAAIRSAFAGGPEHSGRLAAVRSGLRRLGPNLLINLGFFAGFAAAGEWYLYFLLWWVPALTWNRLVTRIRNIGEHAGVPDDDDPLRNTRTTRASLLERAFLAPYFVNYHLEHHLFVSIPCYRLRQAHRLLLAKGWGERMEVQPDYLTMLRGVTLPTPVSPLAR